MLIVGEKEVNEKKVSVRSRDNGEMGAIEVEEFIANVLKEVEERTNVIQA
jgi:threonyl-tRNA synthetase